jgi:hypothetical protein
MDGVLVDFVSGALKLVNSALANPKYNLWEERRALVQRLQKENRDFITSDDLEKPEYRARAHNEVMPEARTFMKVLIAEAGAEWWATLPWTPEGKRLWQKLAKYEPRILSSPMNPLAACKNGKKSWIQINLEPIYKPSEVILTSKKYRLAKGNVLIDDFVLNTVPWENKGGIPIEHKSASLTLKKLEEIIKDAKL